MSETTTIKIYKDNLGWWKICCKVKGKNSIAAAVGYFIGFAVYHFVSKLW
jgi:hypothetical protein